MFFPPKYDYGNTFQRFLFHALSWLITTFSSRFGCNRKTLKWRNCGVAALAHIMGKQCAQLIIMHTIVIYHSQWVIWITFIYYNSTRLSLRGFDILFPLPMAYLCNSYMITWVLYHVVAYNIQLPSEQAEVTPNPKSRRRFDIYIYISIYISASPYARQVKIKKGVCREILWPWPPSQLLKYYPDVKTEIQQCSLVPKGKCQITARNTLSLEKLGFHIDQRGKRGKGKGHLPIKSVPS